MSRVLSTGVWNVPALCSCDGDLSYLSFSSWESGLTSPSPASIIPKDNYVYYTVVTGSTGRLVSIDVSNPSSPSSADTLDITGGTYLVYLGANGNYVFGTDTTELLVVNISDPTNLALDYTHSSISATNLYANQAFTIGANVYLAVLHDYSGASAYGLKIIDVTNVASPSVVSTTNPSGSWGWRNPSGGTMFPQKNGFHIANSIFYTMVNLAGQIDIYDVSTPSSPSLQSNYSTGYESISTLRANSTHLWVGAKKVASTTRYLVCYDITNPASPSFVSETSVGTGTAETIISIALCDNVAFLCKNTATTVKFESWDISTPATPTLIESLTASDTLRIPIHPVDVYGTNLLLAGSANLSNTQPRLMIVEC